MNQKQKFTMTSQLSNALHTHSYQQHYKQEDLRMINLPKPTKKNDTMPNHIDFSITTQQDKITPVNY